MKILCLNESLIIGGQEKIYIEYLKLLEDTTYEIDILIEEDNGERNTFISQVPKKFSNKIRFLCDLKLMNKLEESRKNRRKNIIKKLKYSLLLKKQSKKAKKKLYKYLKENEYDVVLDFANILEPDMAVGKNIRWIHSSMSSMKKKKKEKFKEKVKNSKYTIVIANEMKKEIVKEIGLEKKLVTIYNPFDFEQIKELSEKKDDLNEVENNLIKEPYIIAVSRLDDAHKNITGLIKSYKMALETGIEEKLYIIGEGNDRKKIEALVEKMGLQKKVFLLGMKKNPYIWIKNSKFYVLNSNWEGLPTVLIEALILGKAIISTDCPTGPKEILENGKNGILVERKNLEKLSKEILKMTKDLKLKENYEKKGLDSITRFSKKEVKKELIGLIEE